MFDNDDDCTSEHSGVFSVRDVQARLWLGAAGAYEHRGVHFAIDFDPATRSAVLRFDSGEEQWEDRVIAVDSVDACIAFAVDIIQTRCKRPSAG